MFGIRPYNRYDVTGDDFFKNMGDFERRFWGADVGFKTDVIEKDGEYLLECELPGFKKEDISIDVSNGVMTVSATRDEKKEEKNAKGEYLRRERSYGTFSRSFDVSSVDESAITAAFEDGILKLTLPKIKEQAPETKRIEIK